MTDYWFNRIWQYCLYCLAKREYSQTELRQSIKRKFIINQNKLDKNNIPDQLVIDRVLAELANRGWQNDSRSGIGFVKSKINSGKGSLFIMQGLKQRGIDANLVDAEIELVDWNALAKEVYQKKFPNPLPGDFNDCQKEKARRMRFMLGRGFTFKQISTLFD